MDVYTKEYLDEKFSDMENTLELIKTKLGIKEDDFSFDDTDDKLNDDTIL